MRVSAPYSNKRGVLRFPQHDQPRARLASRKTQAMTTRMTSKTVTFQRPFMLDGFGEAQAAGTYSVETEEEQLDSASVSTDVWKRTCTIIHLVKGTATEYQQIDPDELQDALKR